jgi:peptide/nickel transport system substrate-binding protein
VSITRSRRARVAFAVVAIVAMAATACSSSSKSSSDKGGGSSSTASKADPNGVIKVGYDLIQTPGATVLGDPTTAAALGNSEDALFYMVFGRFLRANADGTFTPQLAKSATITDKNTIDIVLRAGETFSDGTPFDAAAVKASLERAVAAHNIVAYQQQFFSLTTVDVVSSTEVKLNFPDGTAGSWYDAYIGAWQTSITKPGETNWDKPTGAGPMTITSYDRGQKLVFAKNPKYYDPKAVKVAGMEFIHVADAAAQSGIAALRAGQLDEVFTDPAQLASLSGNIKSYSRVSGDQTIWLHMCKRSGPLANAKVRIALNKAIDREAINKAVFQGTGAPSTEMWPAGHEFNDPALNKFLAYDPAAAKKLLQEAGFGGGFTVDVYPIAFTGIPETAEILKQEWAAIGVTANIIPTPNYVGDYLQPKKDGIGIFPGNSVGVQKLNGWTGTGLGNVCVWNDPAITDLAKQIGAISKTDPKARELWFQAEKIVVEQALSGFILFRSSLGAYNTTRLGNMTALLLGQYVVPDPTITYVKAK